MRVRVLVAAVSLVLAGLAVPPALGVAPAPEPAPAIAPVTEPPVLLRAARTTLSAKTSTPEVRYGDGLVLKGVLKAGAKRLKGQKVVVSRTLTASGRTSKAGSTTTRRRGVWKLSLGAQRAGASYRAKFKGTAVYRRSTSPWVAVGVRAPLTGVGTTPAGDTAPVGETRTWTATTDDLLSGSTVLLERDAGGGWVTVGQDAVDAAGAVRIAHTFDEVGAAQFRLRFPATPALLQATSPARTITVTDGTSTGPLTITTASLPDATRGSPYDVTLTASGGSGTRAWEWDLDVPGLTLGATGRITGTPTTAGTWTGWVTVSDDTDWADKQLTLKVTTTEPLTITTPQRLPDAKVGQDVYQEFAVNEQTEVTWTKTAGSFPPGTTLDVWGFLSGSPTTQGSYTFTLRATDGTRTATKSFDLLVLGAGQQLLQIEGWPPSARPGVSYGYRYTANGTGLTWSANGTLPPGLSMGSNGVLSGTPSTVGSWTFTVLATDGTRHASLESTVVVAGDGSGSVAITSLPPSDVGRGTLVSAQLASTATSGVTWTVSGLPPGLSATDSGLISGRPTQTGSWSVDVSVGGDPGYDSASVTMTVTEPADPVIAENQLLAGQVGVEYTFAPHAAGGTPPYTWTVTAGALPAGITLSTKGVLTGTPTTAGTTTPTLRITDGTGATHSKQLPMTVTAVDTSQAWLGDATRRHWAPYEKSLTSDNLLDLQTRYELPAPAGAVELVGNLMLHCVGDSGAVLLRATTASSGAMLWERTVDDCTTIATLPGRVLVAGNDGVRSFATSDGTTQWSTATTDPGKASSKLLATPGAVLSTAGNRVTAYNPTNGTLLWQRFLSANDTTVYDWAADATRVYLAESTGQLRALTLGGTGSPVWSVTAPTGHVVALPDRDEVLVATGAGALSWRSATTGAQLRTWSMAPSGVQDFPWSLAADGQRAYYSTISCSEWGCSGDLHVVTHTGQLGWTTPISMRAWGKPLVTDGLVWTLTAGLPREGGDSQVTAWTTGGRQVGQWTVPGASLLPLEAGGGQVVAPTFQGLYVMGLMAPVPQAPAQLVPGGWVGRPYAAQLTATGGTGSRTWSVASGSPPAGVSLSPGGALTGTPTTAGRVTFTARVTDVLGLATTVQVRIPVRAVQATPWLTAALDGARSGAVLGLPLDEDELTTVGQRWAVDTGVYLGVAASPLVHGGRWFEVQDGVLTAYSTTSGSATPLWTRSLTDESFLTGLTMSASGTDLYAQATSGRLTVIDPTNGSVRWQGPPPASGSYRLDQAPLVVGGKAVLRYGSEVVAVDLTTRGVAWSSSAVAPGWTGLSTDGTRIYAWSHCHVVAVRVSDGTSAWSSPVDPGSNCHHDTTSGGGPLVSDGRVHSVGWWGHDTFDAATGAVLWRRPASHSDSDPAANEHYLVTAANSGLEVVDKASGKVLYTTTAARSDCGVTLVGDTALLCAWDQVVAFDVPSRRIVWQGGNTGSQMVQRLVVNGDRFYARTVDGRLRGYGRP